MLITLHSNGYEVAVNTMGAELKSFKDPSGKEYVWNSDPAFWMRSSPLLFPTIGNLRNGLGEIVKSKSINAGELTQEKIKSIKEKEASEKAKDDLDFSF